MGYRAELVIIFILFVFSFTGCGGSSSSSPESDEPNPGPEALVPESLSGLDGTFKSQGYAWIVDIDVAKNSARILDVTEISCLRILQNINTLEDADAAFNIVRIEGVNDAFLTKAENNTRTTSFVRIDELPEPCESDSSLLETDSLKNFDIFWATFNENYPFFTLRGIDWAAQYETYRPQVSSSTNEQSLFQILSNMVAPLDDSHVSIISPFGLFNAGASEERNASSP